MKKIRAFFPAAKYLALICAVSVLAGCENSQEERDFFYDGWTHPQQGSDRRFNGGQLGDPIDSERSLDDRRLLDPAPTR